MIVLVKPKAERASEYLELCKEYGLFDKSKHIHIDSLEKAEKRIEFDLSLEEKEELPEGRVRQLIRWAQNEDGKIVGTCRIRLKLNENLKKTGGHIGYDVRPEFRRKGIGTEILKLALKELRAKINEDVLITCDDDNIGSSRVIENNGGILENIIIDEESGKLVRRYWIKRNNRW